MPFNGSYSMSKVQPPATAFAGPLQRDKRPKVLSHIKWIKRLPCIACGLPDHSDAHHLKPACALAGKRESGSQKPDDCWTVPLCRPCHDQLHRIGDELRYWSRFGGYFRTVAKAAFLWAMTGDDYQGNQIVERRRAIDPPPSTQ